jgi:hypothetical protein
MMTVCNGTLMLWLIVWMRPLARAPIGDRLRAKIKNFGKFSCPCPINGLHFP